LLFVLRFSDVRADYQRALARSSGAKSIHDHEALNALLVNMQVCLTKRSPSLGIKQPTTMRRTSTCTFTLRMTRWQASLETTLSLCSRMQDCRADVAQQALRVASVIPKSNQVSDLLRVTCDV
jgi:hypothetical protein